MCAQSSLILWIHGLQVPLSMEFSRQGYGHFLHQGIFSTQGSNSCLLCLLHWQADFFTTVPPETPQIDIHSHKIEWNIAFCSNMNGHEIIILSKVRHRKTNIIRYHLFLESKKPHRWIYFTKQITNSRA